MNYIAASPGLRHLHVILTGSNVFYQSCLMVLLLYDYVKIFILNVCNVFVIWRLIVWIMDFLIHECIIKSKNSVEMYERGRAHPLGSTRHRASERSSRDRTSK
uniref:Uncharacterized protein n=1 Tax=Pararge aegeria TaxID=116150 RepID=S4PLJ9_9NEOP